MLYWAFKDSNFIKLHEYLKTKAIKGEIRYILRYKPTLLNDEVDMVGYGMSVVLKNTEYLGKAEISNIIS